MVFKIQITVDERLNNAIRARAAEMGLSVSSYARLALLHVLPSQEKKLLDQALRDVKNNRVESLTLEEFNHQLGNL